MKIEADEPVFMSDGRVLNPAFFTVYHGPDFKEGPPWVRWLDTETGEYAAYVTDAAGRNATLQVRRSPRIRINFDAKCVFIL